MKRLVLFALALIMVLSGLAGCAPSAAPVEQTPEERVLRLRLPSSLTSTDWTASMNSHDMKVWQQIFEGLYGMDEANNGYYPELAKELKLSDDQMVYTITLVDAKFQNGEPLTAADVVFSYDYAMANPGFNYLTSMIDTVEAQDEKTVIINLKYPYAPIDHTFFNVKIMNEKEVKEQGDKFGTMPHKAATGAYYVSEYDVATGVKLAAFKDYWRGEPKVKLVEYRVIPDDAAAVVAYEKGELDYYEEAPLAEWTSLEAAAKGSSAIIKGNNILWFGINFRANEALANLKVRQAIFYAINKQDINLAVSDGHGVPAVHYMPPEYVPTSPKDGFETYNYDPEKAKALLVEAGYPDGVEVGTILSTTSSKNAKMAQVIQANLAEVGIKAELSALDVTIAVEKWNAQDFDMCVYADSGNYDFNNIRQQVHSESVGMYVIKYEDSDFDWNRMEELIDLGVSVADVGKRVEYYTELWKLVMDSATILPCLHWPTALVWSPDLEIGTPVPTYYKIRTFYWK